MDEVDWIKINKSLDELWDGPLYKFRDGVFDLELSYAVKKTLTDIRIPHLDYFPREFVTFLWSIPIFMEWQKDYISKVNSVAVSSEYNNLCLWVEDYISHIFGRP